MQGVLQDRFIVVQKFFDFSADDLFFSSEEAKRENQQVRCWSSFSARNQTLAIFQMLDVSSGLLQIWFDCPGQIFKKCFLIQPRWDWRCSAASSNSFFTSLIPPEGQTTNYASTLRATRKRPRFTFRFSPAFYMSLFFCASNRARIVGRKKSELSFNLLHHLLKFFF